MQACSVAVALLTSAVLTAAAWAAPPPNDVTFAGYVTPVATTPTGAGAWCMTGAATSTFVRSQTPVQTLMSLSEVIYAPNGSIGFTAYRLSGQARLLFDAGSATNGKLSFDANSGYPASVYQPTFNLYSENYNSATRALTVRFRLHFADCVLPIVAVYRN